jgi:serine phosphatase RsbU (regulator of sigma subunit)
VGPATLTIASAARCFPGEDVSGDGWTVEWNGDKCRLTVIDGLGHGPAAAEAASSAKAILAMNPGLGPIAALMACHEAMGHTRGAAILSAEIDLAARMLTYAGIGNVEARLCDSVHDKRLVSFRGIVGSTISKIQAYTLDIPDEWVLVVHTDGVSSRFTTSPHGENNLQALADAILKNWGRDSDDATVVVVGPGSDGR